MTPATLSRNQRLTFTCTALAALLGLALIQNRDVSANADGAPAYLTSRPKQLATADVPVKVGEEVRTASGQRRRALLPDGSILYVNQKTSVRIEKERQLTLATGEVFVEVAAGQKATRDPFVVKAPQREVAGQKAKFVVRADDTGTSVVVTRDQVKVSGLDDPLLAGQQLTPANAKPVPAPRATHLLDWTRDLMAAADSPLVPTSKYAGGALVAIDPNGQEAKLSLRQYHVDVYIEDGFARTTIDQTYFNHESSRLEGTFYFPLPPDASLSRLAMYVDGNRMEGGMTERDYARQVFETILYRQRDPALLEWVDGSTFKMRVFPLDGRQEKRIILSYTQKLPALYGQVMYRFPAGHGLELVRDWSFHVRFKNGADSAWNSTSHTLRATRDGTDLVLDAAQKNVKGERDLTLSLSDKSATAQTEEAARFSFAEQEGARYLMLRYRPDLPDRLQNDLKNPKSKTENPKNWVFLFESSGDRDPLLARVQIDIIRSLLANAEADDTFTVLTAGTRVRALAGTGGLTSPAGLLQVTPENVQAAVAFLERAHLIGALDLGRALTEAEPFLKEGKNAYLVHVGSGIAAMGERREDVLAKRIPEGAHYVGVGVGRRWARSFMKAAAERTDGYFTQINPDEPVSWRAFELQATLNMPRLLNAKAVDNAERVSFLSYATAVAQGEELCAIARLEPDQKTLPASVTVTGTLAGQPFRRVLPVKDVAEHADYLPRTWAKLEIERLLAEDAAKNKKRVIELSKAMYVMTPFTSLLVLENEDMYEQYQVDRGRKDHWAMYPCAAKIPVVYEPDPTQPADPRNAPKTGIPGKRLPASQVVQTIVVRTQPDLLKGSRQIGTDDGVDFVHSHEDKTIVVSQQFKPFPVLDSFSRQNRALKHQIIAVRGLEDFDRTFTQDLNIPIRASSFNNPRDFVTGLTPAAGLARELDNDGYLLQQLSVRSEDMRPVILSAAISDQKIVRRLMEAEAVGGQSETMRESRLQAIMSTLGPAERNTNFIKRLNQAMRFITPVFEGGAVGQPIPVTQTGRLVFGGYPADSEILRNISWRSALTPDVQEQLQEVSAAPKRDSWLYERPSFNNDDRIYYDLVAYAPGMDTSWADIQAVLEAEAVSDPRSAPGRIDPAARQLIDKARSAGWQALEIPGVAGQSAFKLVFDGSGRYAYERTLPIGLHERVVCDGQTLLHLYPDLGLGARRHVSRFHRDELANLVPWVVPSAEDLSHGADLQLVAERTVAIIPRSRVAGAESAKPRLTADSGASKTQPRPPELLAKYVRLHLVFAADGRLAERQIVEMPAKKVLYRQTCGSDGDLRLLDAKGKELSVRKWTLSPAPTPDLKPDTQKLLVLALPFRTPEHVRESLKIQDKSYENLRTAGAVALFTAYVGAGNGTEALQVFRKSLYDRDVRHIGLYVLLGACEQILNAEHTNVLAEHPDEPLAQYLALYSSSVLRKHMSQLAADSGQWSDGLLHRLALAHALGQRWQNIKADKHGTSTPRYEAQRRRALDFIRANKNSGLGWSLLCLLQDKAGDDQSFHRDLAAAWQLFEDVPGLAYAARYEHARSLWKAGQQTEARQKFRDLYEATLKEDVLPPIDADFRQALLGEGKEPDQWSELLRQTAARFIDQKRRRAVLALAWQCWQLDDQPRANHLFAMAFDVTPEKERPAMTLAAIDYLMETSQLEHADQLLRRLLADPKLAKSATLWRRGVKLAEQRDMTARGLECLEQALEAEYQNLPEVIDLEAVRQDYAKLLKHYQTLADAMTTLKVRPPADFLVKVVRAADRWRSLDNDSAAACQSAARILRTAGDRDLVWDYLTTPVAMRPNEAEPWVSLAQTLSRKGDAELADRAYTAAFEAEPTNAEILWDRAQNLRQAGKRVEAQKLLHQLADGTWQPRFQWIQSQARSQLRDR